jgi:hypothetical protein
MTDPTGFLPNPEHDPTAVEPEHDGAAVATQDRYADWPAKGGSDAPQPWDLAELGIDPRDEDARTPVQPRAGLPLLTSGSQGVEVRELGQRLGELGYPNSVTRGENPYGVYDQSIHDAVESFRRDYDVREDPSAFIRDGKTQSATHTGPWTQEAIIRASDRERDQG